MSWLWGTRTSETAATPADEELRAREGEEEIPGESSPASVTDGEKPYNDEDEDEDKDKDEDEEDNSDKEEEDVGEEIANGDNDDDDDDDDDDDGESSDESFSDDSLDDDGEEDDDDDDDSLVVDLIENVTTDDETIVDDGDNSSIEKEREKEKEIETTTTTNNNNNEDVEMEEDEEDDGNDEDDDGDEEDDEEDDRDDKQMGSSSNSEGKKETGAGVSVTTNIYTTKSNGTSRDDYDDESDDDDDESDDDDDYDDDPDGSSEDPVASFWEKQSLLVLAAEHDRVDILKTLLSEENEEKDALVNTGIPPLHLAITFGSVNTARSLLRMGSDPSVRPDVSVVLEERRNQPKDSKVDIPNIHRFDGVTAWELAFGNALYDETKTTASARSSWTIFGSSSAATTPTNSNSNFNANVDTATATPTNESSSSSSTATNSSSSNRVVKPVDMAPSKREGIRHAFTAEALRSVGGDEVQRLKQLLDSGMPADIDIGGKDLYEWAVDMGANRCRELLEPVEETNKSNAATTSTTSTSTTSTSTSTNNRDGDGVDRGDEPATAAAAKPSETTDRSSLPPPSSSSSSSFVVHRPDVRETIPQLRNRLDELESLAAALSTCLDNLAEEVSVCHGLLLMGGGAAALASHVRSLRALREQKLERLEDAEAECDDAERELSDLVLASGAIGREIASANHFLFLLDGPFSSSTAAAAIGGSGDSNNGGDNVGDSDGDRTANDSFRQEEAEAEQINLKAQIAASENKIRKLRASIADLSEENTRDLKEVRRRGLEGGINLVRGLREELRDFDYHLSEARSAKAVCRAKISRILAQISGHSNRNKKNAAGGSAKAPGDASSAARSGAGGDDEPNATTTSSVAMGPGESATRAPDEEGGETDEAADEPSVSEARERSQQNGAHAPIVQKTPARPPEREETNARDNQTRSNTSTSTSTSAPTATTNATATATNNTTNTNAKTASQKISTGDSQAISVLQPGSPGLFSIDLWEVILRIIGYERAANRRSVQNATKAASMSHSNVMII